MRWWLALLCAAGCEEAPPPPVAFGSDASVAIPSASGRLLQRVYVVANRSGECVMYWREGEQTSVEAEIPCPRELEVGERLRYTGRTCMRESSDASRNLPVRCPKQISHALRDEKNGKGELELPPAGASAAGRQRR
jgi:hypothetical protein